MTAPPRSGLDPMSTSACDIAMLDPGAPWNRRLASVTPVPSLTKILVGYVAATLVLLTTLAILAPRHGSHARTSGVGDRQSIIDPPTATATRMM